MKVTSQRHQTEVGEITTYRIENASGASVTLSSLGAGIIGTEVPDRYGKLENVALAYAEPASYMADGPCMGKVPGRYANRIARGLFSIDGNEYKLAINNGPNALHGGPTGFQNRIWDSEITNDGVRFSYTSADGEEGYPGNLKVTAEYKWDDNNRLTLRLSAVSDVPTVVNLTNHAYWNLDGADSGSVLDHLMKIRAERWLPTDDTLIPTGEEASVEGTPMDFRRTKRIGEDIKADFDALKYGKGYDNCWVIENWEPGKMQEAVELSSEKSGRKLIVSTDQPGVQVYTGNWLAGSPLNHSGRSYEDYDGVAIEAQGYPDAPNEPGFPSQLVDAEHPYERTIEFAFGK